MTDAERDALLIRMDSALEAIREKVEEDRRALRGNGQPGLIERVTRLEDAGHHTGRLWVVLGFLLNAGLAILALIRRAGQ